MFSLQLRSAERLALCQRDVQRLPRNVLAVHLRDSLGSLLRSREANEAEAFGLAGLLVHHDFVRRDGPKLGELLEQPVVVDLVMKVFDVEVDARELALALQLELLKALTELLLAFLFALGTTHVQLASFLELCVGERLNGRSGGLWFREVHEAKGTGLVLFLVTNAEGRGDFPVLAEQLVEFLLGEVLGQVVHVHVGETGAVSASTFLLGLEGTHSHALASNHLAVHTFDGALSSLLALIVDEPVAERFTLGVGGHLAREDVAEHAERVIQALVVDGTCQVLHEDVSDT
mmetsp:Transcript_8534/g.9667  ORF Transcript_8534/g.9667 Transcript_8534/m.9667 type:complete len:289 (+) Transcript_8534:993-1859(+)